MVETGGLSKFLRKGMIGASDGFDLSNPNSDILITVFGLVSRLFIKSLREKVMRGMKGAARRGTCLGQIVTRFHPAGPPRSQRQYRLSPGWSSAARTVHRPGHAAVSA